MKHFCGFVDEPTKFNSTGMDVHAMFHRADGGSANFRGAAGDESAAPIKDTDMKIDMGKHKYAPLLAAAGFAFGVYYAIEHKTGFWMGAGYTLLFNLTGYALGAGIDATK